MRRTGAGSRSFSHLEVVVPESAKSGLRLRGKLKSASSVPGVLQRVIVAYF